MYYHFDYVGGPRNSKWVNISPIPRVWEQMNLCYEYGINKIWIVNVGDLKPMEYPITFFCDMAWNPAKYNQDNLVAHAEEFCRSVFGEEHAQEAARLLRTYAKFNRRVTPESLNMTTYSFHYNEWYRVCADYNKLAADARALEQKLPAEARSAYFELLGLPIEDVANLYNLYYAQAMNKRLAKQHNEAANAWAQKTELKKNNYLAPLAEQQKNYTKDPDYENNRLVHFNIKLENKAVTQQPGAARRTKRREESA